ncbi:MAG: phosphate ABC transporter permease family protein, partial [Thermoanaerobaculia bacterium]|nr:phosphate ABC transporter permease family protein [Thermoanaerobaculia bacterium]
MTLSLLLITLLALSSLAYRAGVRRALHSAGGSARNLHSLPAYHGLH